MIPIPNDTKPMQTGQFLNRIAREGFALDGLHAGNAGSLVEKWLPKLHFPRVSDLSPIYLRKPKMMRCGWEGR